nr:SDR family NAD(P)-dependent oxidoreductase [uncultured Carboxylicivirga sp.]
MNFTDLVPVVRILFSKEGLVTAKALLNIDNIEGLRKVGYDLSDDECITILPGDDKADLVALLKEQVKSNTKAVVFDGLGAVVKGKKVDNPNPYNPVEGRIVIVTGGAQGFGGGIAEELYAKGAHVVVADLNHEVGRSLVEKLKSSKQMNKAVFIPVNVGDSDSVKSMIETTVLELGGLDVIISNAGILRAGGLDEMDPDTFNLMTKVNYAGYFYCAKHASKVMKLQSQVDENHYMDIIQINSKSGLKGSNRNFAYAGGKFGGIGLTQSFALELMPNRIKVNSICPGNFFDGPLWSDPEKGLFVQYLNAGKVPGAKTIEDVQAHYEKQVPAGRGCRVADVAKAIVYVINQEYETGQAVPVTGGQEMLN